jgi:hypothetical protein
VGEEVVELEVSVLFSEWDLGLTESSCSVCELERKKKKVKFTRMERSRWEKVKFRMEKFFGLSSTQQEKTMKSTIRESEATTSKRPNILDPIRERSVEIFKEKRRRQPSFRLRKV